MSVVDQAPRMVGARRSHGVGRRLSIGAVTVLTASILAMGNAGAHVWRTGLTGCGPVNSADSAAHGYWYNAGLSAAMVAETNWSRANNYDGTDINTFNVAALAADTDVVVYDQDYTTYCGFAWDGSGGDVVGLAECKSLAVNPANACEKHEVRYDESATIPAVQNWRRSLACHENGHTLGLAHQPSNSCINEDISALRFGLTQGNIDWINSHY